MKRKKMFFFIISIGIFGLCAVFMTQKMSTKQGLPTAYNIEEGISNGDVIQDGNQIHNLLRLEQFYQNMNRNIEDSIVIVIHHSNQSSKFYELFYANEQLKLYSDIQMDELGRKEYKIKMYQDIKKILKNNQVIYKLVNENEERKFLSYNLK